MQTMNREELKKRLIFALQEGAARGGISRTTSYDEERENDVVVAINPMHTEVEIDFGVFADVLIEAGVVFKRDYRKSRSSEIQRQERFAEENGFTPDCSPYYIAAQYKKRVEALESEITSLKNAEKTANSP